MTFANGTVDTLQGQSDSLACQVPVPLDGRHDADGHHPGVIPRLGGPRHPLYALDHIFELADLLLIMTVNPGFGGQKFIEAGLQKVKVLKKKLERHGLETPIEVDGGVNVDNIAELSKAGADVFVAGSAIFGAATGSDVTGIDFGYVAASATGSFMSSPSTSTV